MFISNLGHSIKDAALGAGVVAHRGLVILKKHPQLTFYPYLAASFILFTAPLVTAIVVPLWSSVNEPAVIHDATNSGSHEFLAHLGLVGFTVFYTIFVSAYFICAVSAETIAELEGRPVSATYGIRKVLNRFLSVTKFAIIAIFFFPLSVTAQFRKLRTPRGAVEVIGSSLSLNMAQLAPTILYKDMSVFDSIRHSVNTLGRAWRENLVIKVGTYLALVILAFASFLPKLVEQYWFDSESAHILSWLLTILLGAVSYVVVKVIGGIFTTVLYHKAELKNK